MKVEVDRGLVIYAVLAAVAVALVGAAMVAAVHRAWPFLVLALAALAVFAGLVWILLHAWKA